MPEVTGDEPVGADVRSAGEQASTTRSWSGVDPAVGVDTDDELVRTLYAAHGAAVFGYVQRLLGGDRQRAEDVVQETFVRVWRRPGELSVERGSVRSWLLTIARNLVIDGERARRVRPREVGEYALARVAEQVDQIDEATVAFDVAEVMAALPPHHREVIVEVYYQGRSVNEAATALGIPAGTVKSRTYYALRQLRLLLEERGMIGEVGS